MVQVREESVESVCEQIDAQHDAAWAYLCKDGLEPAKIRLAHGLCEGAMILWAGMTRKIDGLYEKAKPDIDLATTDRQVYDIYLRETERSDLPKDSKKPLVSLFRKWRDMCDAPGAQRPGP